MEVSTDQKKIFHETLWGYYIEHGRHDLPWRQSEPDTTFDPYKIMVSELMLQQTQVGRVIPKYDAFIKQFPDVRSLAGATIGDVLRAWQGLGYNRRAKFLWQTANLLCNQSSFPQTATELTSLPGIGVNTAGAILAYSFNSPVLFIETNIRTVYIHHFMGNQDGIDDKQIRMLLEQTLDSERPREFYWALMDYGSYLKGTIGNTARASKHFTKQATFKGSNRQLRGQIIRVLSAGSVSRQVLAKACNDDRLSTVLQELEIEGLIKQSSDLYSLD